MLWGPIARQARDITPDHGLGKTFLDWLAGCAMIYFTLFGVGKIIFGHWGTGLLFLCGAITTGGYLLWDLRRQDWHVLTDSDSLTRNTSSPKHAPLLAPRAPDDTRM